MADNDVQMKKKNISSWSKDYNSIASRILKSRNTKPTRNLENYYLKIIN